ncbi:MAG: MBL fold metallo-hydrolase [Proteobacteria bacterium]|nr:MBL fold metallo-hydrolase [Pseudomonadota bacterium]
MKRNITLIFAGFLLLAQPAHATSNDDAGGALTFTFIGNEAFAITDGEATLVSDFPYQSGYSIYMEYDPAALEIAGEVVALITHRHGDHFDANLFAERDWKIIGPREVTDGIAPERVVPLAIPPLSNPKTYFYSPFKYENIFVVGDMLVYAFPTPHSGTGHYSYAVDWRGQSLYFFGDTETPKMFLDIATGLGDFDVVFMTPWVLRPLLADGTDIPAKLIVIYHQQVGEALPQCGKCRALVQGESFTLD